MRPAHSVATAMKTLEARVETAVADGVVTRDEKRAIDAQAKRAEGRAQALVAHSGAPALDAIAALRRMDRAALVARGDEALATLAQGRHAMWREARHDAHTNPFRGDLLRNARTPFAGARTKDFTWQGHRVHLVAVDLAHPDIKLQTTGPGARGKNLDDMTRGKRAEIGINGDFFSPGSNYATSGAAMTNGARWPGSANGEAWEPALVWKGKHAAIKGYNSPLPSWAKNAVSARPTVLRDGDVITNYPEPDKAAESRRTGVGVSKSGRMLFLVAVEGGLSAKELGRLMKRVGADDAMAMDAGGSAQMFEKGRGYVQRSSDPGGERRIANAILINNTRR